MDTFDTYSEARQALVIDPLIACGQDLDDFDIDAIADATIGVGTLGPGAFLYSAIVDVDTFWQIVRQHDRTQTAVDVTEPLASWEIALLYGSGSTFYDTLQPAIVTGPRPVHGRYV